MAQPHQGDPAQAAGLDQLVAAGTHRVPVDAPSFDLGTTTPFQGLIDAENQRAVAAVQVLEQQRQQDASRLRGRPYRPVEHLMVAGVVEVVAAAHDAQRCGHGALARGQYRPEQQHLGFPPSRVGKQRYEGNEYGYNGIGQGEHGWTFSEIWVRPAYPVLLLSLNFAQSPAKVMAWKKGGRNGVVVRGAGGPGAGSNPDGGTVRIGGRVPWGAEVQYAYRAGYDSRGRVSVTHLVDERGYAVMLTKREPDGV